MILIENFKKKYPEQQFAKQIIITAQYMNCAAANSGADAGMYDASSEIYKLSTKINGSSDSTCL